MKQFAVLIALMALVIGFAPVAQAQIAPSVFTVASGVDYENDSNDTTKVMRFGGANRLSAVLTTTDTCAIDVYIQYSANYFVLGAASATWTTIVTDSLIYANTGTGFKEYSILDLDSDLFDGVAGGVRTVLVARASGNGVAGTTQYTLRYYGR